MSEHSHAVPDRIDAAGFREAMSSVVAPVTVITAQDAFGELFGFTASAVVSLSLDPPLLLVCVDRKSSSHDRLLAAAQFCVNVLGADSEDVALRCGKSRVDKFDGVALEDDPPGPPSLSAAVACIYCAAHGIRDGGDHTIVLGRVLRFTRRPQEPLALYNRGFRRLARSA